ncbi:MAG: ABC transporter substrate-binding protein, partial [Coriobacteriales bacterium]|nr:ABC transporter substrate-binding protein [Coriobacteriales bacterium]
AYLPEGTDRLPYLGSTSGNGEIDREQLLVEDIQIVFSISGQPLASSNVSEAEDLQKHTNIPCLVVDGSFGCVASAYRFLGDILGAQTRAEELAVYCEETYARVTAAVANIPDAEKVTFYYAEGPEGLQTEPDASQHGLTFNIAGANNVAAVPENEGLGMSNVSLEQVLAWDPEVIVAWDLEVRGGADEMIRTNPNWAQIRAVKTGRVYTMPNVPFAWCDRPPGVNRLLGIQWVANMLYPARYDVDMVEVTRDFYSTMYWADITDEQAKEILSNSYPPYKGRAIS